MSFPACRFNTLTHFFSFLVSPRHQTCLSRLSQLNILLNRWDVLFKTCWEHCLPPFTMFHEVITGMLRWLCPPLSGSQWGDRDSRGAPSQEQLPAYLSSSYRHAHFLKITECISVEITKPENWKSLQWHTGPSMHGCTCTVHLLALVQFLKKHITIEGFKKLPHTAGSSIWYYLSSAVLSHSVMSDSLQLHGL